MTKHPMPSTVKYLDYTPRKVPAGKVLVHNRVKPAYPIGRYGFRIWLQSRSDAPALELCACEWAPHLKEHYRVSRFQATNTTSGMTS